MFVVHCESIECRLCTNMPIAVPQSRPVSLNTLCAAVCYWSDNDSNRDCLSDLMYPLSLCLP